MSKSSPRPPTFILLLLLPYISPTLGGRCFCNNATDPSILSLIQLPAPTLAAVSNDPAASSPFRGLYALSCGNGYYQQVKDFFNTSYSEEYKAYGDCGAQCSANPSCVAYFTEVKSTAKATCTFKCHLYLFQFCIRGFLKGPTHGFYSATIPRAPPGHSVGPIPLVTACSGNSQGCTVADSSYNASASVPTTGIPAFGEIDPDQLVAGESPLNGTSCDLDSLSPVSGVIKGLIRTSLASASFSDLTPEDCGKAALSTGTYGAQYFSWIPSNVCTGTCYVYLSSSVFPYGAASGAITTPPFDPTAPAFTGQLPTLM